MEEFAKITTECAVVPQFKGSNSSTKNGLRRAVGEQLNGKAWNTPSSEPNLTTPFLMFYEESKTPQQINDCGQRNTLIVLHVRFFEA